MAGGFEAEVEERCLGGRFASLDTESVSMVEASPNKVSFTDLLSSPQLGVEMLPNTHGGSKLQPQGCCMERWQERRGKLCCRVVEAGRDTSCPDFSDITVLRTCGDPKFLKIT
jgi:hypothetical protein